MGTLRITCESYGVMTVMSRTLGTTAQLEEKFNNQKLLLYKKLRKEKKIYIYILRLILCKLRGIV
jgi:hypothetical protein